MRISAARKSGGGGEDVHVGFAVSGEGFRSRAP